MWKNRWSSQSAASMEAESLLYNLAAGLNSETSLNHKVYMAQESVIKEIAGQKPCVIAGRCAGEILRERANTLCVLIHGNQI